MLGSTFLLSQDQDIISEVLGIVNEEAIAFVTTDAEGGAVLVVLAGKAASWFPFMGKANRKKVIAACKDGAYFALNECGCEKLTAWIDRADRKAANICKASGFDRVGLSDDKKFIEFVRHA